MKPKQHVRTKRLNLRATHGQDELIRAGAQIRRVNVSEFVLESACKQAEQDIADQVHFAVPKDKWNEFVRALDRPARVKPELRKLFAERTVLVGSNQVEDKTVSGRKARRRA